MKDLKNPNSSNEERNEEKIFLKTKLQLEKNKKN